MAWEAPSRLFMSRERLALRRCAGACTGIVILCNELLGGGSEGCQPPIQYFDDQNFGRIDGKKVRSRSQIDCVPTKETKQPSWARYTARDARDCVLHCRCGVR